MAILGYSYGARQLADARCSLSEFRRRLPPGCCRAAAQRLPPRAVVSCSGQGLEAEGAASAARSPGRGSRLGRPVWHARAGCVRSRWGLPVLICIYILTVCCIYPIKIGAAR
jgi:hypothetical protein